MDNNHADNVQDVDNGNESDEAMGDCLRNPVILTRIFRHISSTELLQISLVNKLWKFQARSVLRKRGNLIANLRSNRNGLRGDTCEAVEAFVSDLPELSAVPYSGINFENSYHNHVCSLGRLARLQDANLLDHLPLKKISVIRFGSSWPRFRNCPAILLANKVLREFCGVLEELELKIRGKLGDDIGEVIEECHFPRLKILKVGSQSPKGDFENLMRALLSRVPNLQTLHTDWNISSVLCLLRGTSVEFAFTKRVNAPFDEVPESVTGSFRLHLINLIHTGPEFDLERFNRIAPMLLQAICTKPLRDFSVDAVLALPLMCYGFRMEIVKNLYMDIDVGLMERIEPRILNFVKKFDFTRIFPNLDKVCVVCINNYRGLPLEHVNLFIERANAVLREPLPDRAARIKRLFLLLWHPCSISAQFFVEMFPNIEKLQITTAARRPIPFGSIWNWLDLNELQIRGNMLPTTGNLDSVFCGIFPEEVQELRMKDDEYLKKVNIVPVMPAVTCLRNLRTIALHLRHDPEDSFGDATFMFSKVTALLAFARRPTLAVSLKITAHVVPPALTHLEPYVSVTYNLVEDY